MKYGRLRDHFRCVGVKCLTTVDAEPKSSNQHEIGITQTMRREFLGEGPKKNFPTIYIWLGRDQAAVTIHSWATYYDAREHQPLQTPKSFK